MEVSTSVAQIVRCVREFTLPSFTVKNIVEIGAFDATDSYNLAHEFYVPHENVFVVEPNPEQHAEIEAEFPMMNLIKKVIDNKAGTVPFYSYNVNGVDAEGARASSSSQKRTDQAMLHNPTVYDVEAITGKELLKECELDQISILKIDVEGTAYEVLQGFGNILGDIQVIQIETDLKPICEGQTKLHDDVANQLLNAGFICYEVRRHWDIMLDSLWIHKLRCHRNKTRQWVKI